MLTNYPFSQSPAFAEAFAATYRCDEASAVKSLIALAKSPEANIPEIRKTAEKLILNVRRSRLHSGGLDAFLAEYDLSSEEGITLMCLAEALLRIPDALTADKLIADKLTHADWKRHVNQSDSTFVNAATWGLMLTGKILSKDKQQNSYLTATFNKLLARSSPAVIRTAMKQAMKILGKQFVLGQSIEEGIKRAQKRESVGFRYSYDMLGEAARTEQDAEHYQKAYRHAIHSIGQSERLQGVYKTPGISIKLSALMARYELAQIERVFAELLPRVKELCMLAKSYDIGLTIDAEEADRLQLSLAIIERLALDEDLAHWQGLGLAIQAYQKRTLQTIDFLAELANRSQHRFMVRLVKGAYWDAEIKRCQELGLEDYPVYTRKVYSDVSYLACARKLFANPGAFYPMIATHNAYSLAAVLDIAGNNRDFEFQCLHGMGDPLYEQVVGVNNLNIPCRIYAPCGGHEYLLAYLVRRLLENGANSSFVNRIIDESVPVSDLLQDPVAEAEQLAGQPHPHIPLPRQIYGDHMNSKGIDLSSPQILKKLALDMAEACKAPWRGHPMIAGERKVKQTEFTYIRNPANTNEVVGQVIEADKIDVELAITAAGKAFKTWQKTSAEERAVLLERTADLLEQHMTTLMAMAVKEAGKSIPNAVGEVREAVDFCRYYAAQTRIHFSKPIDLPGPTGEKNQLSLHGRGIVVCISPWNFPLAIFVGEVTAALAAGNVVIAKPAEQTPLIACAAVALLHEAGFPKDVLQLLPGSGEVVGAGLTSDPRIAGVIFTGSNQTAKLINQTLANRDGAIPFLIAETGGQNAMIVDSSALPEQVVGDVVASAFDSAGQRCSALRVLYVQEDIAEKVITMIKGAMDELCVGDPVRISTDIGPVIDQEAQSNLLTHIETLATQGGKLLHQAKLPGMAAQGTFVAPTLFEIPSISVLQREVFGPVLHVIRFRANALHKVVEDVNSTGFGLTFGIHSRIEETVQFLRDNVHAGNTYVNRNIVGAVVGVQPFGGEGLSGTGPKAGGPFYLPRLALERTVTVNTTAAGGNASLMSLNEA